MKVVKLNFILLNVFKNNFKYKDIVLNFVLNQISIIWGYNF